MKLPAVLDNQFIQKTFLLAKKGEAFTSPNPLVGALIVKDNKIIAGGYHKRCGLAHAEIEAIHKTKQKHLCGSTLYVNLEPCSHFGRTPPCVDQIIKNKIKRVVIATLDPNPTVKGKSVRKLKKAGIKVDVGLLCDEARKLNEVFFKNMKDKMPFVVVKVAQSLDGKIATEKGLSKWITTAKSRKLVRSLRDKYDSVLVGANTFIKDNPRLNGLRKIPYKIVISSQLNLPSGHYLFKTNPHKLIIFSSYKNRNKLNNIPKAAKLIFLKETKGELPLRNILKILYKLGVMSVFVEGGSDTLGRFFRRKLIDKAYFFISPKIIGGKGALTSVGAKGFASPGISPYLDKIEIKKIGEDILIEGYLRY